MSDLQTADARVDDVGLPVEVEPALPAGAVLGSWRVLRALGEGGMGRVYLAEHVVIGRRAAIKVLKRALSTNAMSVERFFDEARAVNSVHHEGIVDVTDLFVVDGQPCIVMELLSGETLAARLLLGPLSPAVVVEIGMAVAEALGAAHAAGIVHRDLKPDNIMIVSSSPLRLKVLDFGVAKLGSTVRERGLTAAGTIVGTPEFMAPEQLAGNPVDHRADIYALGIVLFQMLSGTLPFAGNSFGDWVVQHMTVPAPDIRRRAANVPQPLATLIGAMLEKDREARPPSMAAVVDALRAASHALSKSAHDDDDNNSDGADASGSPRAAGFPWHLSIAAAVAVVVAVAGLSMVWRPASDAAPSAMSATTIEATPAVVTPSAATVDAAPTAPTPQVEAATTTTTTTPTTPTTPTTTTTPITTMPTPTTPPTVSTAPASTPAPAKAGRSKPAPPSRSSMTTTPTTTTRSRPTSKSAVVDPFAEDS